MENIPVMLLILTGLDAILYHVLATVVPVKMDSSPAETFISALEIVILVEPSIDLLAAAIAKVRAVPHLAVVIFAVPLKEVPFMVRAVCNLVALATLSVICAN